MGNLCACTGTPVGTQYMVAVVVLQHPSRRVQVSSVYTSKLFVGKSYGKSLYRGGKKPKLKEQKLGGAGRKKSAY